MMMAVDITAYAVATLVSGTAGFAGGVAAFRTRLALHEQATMQQRATDKEQFERIDRRTRLTLQLVADVARHVGADKRFSDVVVRFLTEEEVV